MKQHSGSFRQRGATLAIVLILLTLMAMLCAASLRGTAAAERMAAAEYDRGLAFHAAETALREGEELLRTAPPFPISGCEEGLCATRIELDATDLPRWRDPNVAWRPVAADLDVANRGGGTIETPAEYLIEKMYPAPNWPGCDREVPMHAKCMSVRYRITARSTQEDRAHVVLQASVSYRR